MNASNVDGELVAVATVFRHGERTPISFYPTDPHKNLPIWNAPPGELTNDGKMEMFELGKWLRERYNDFLSTTYKKNEIYILSSDEDRCVLSAGATLAGLYPPKSTDIWNPDLLWQPIPTHTKPNENDDMFATWQYTLRFQRFPSKLASFQDGEIEKLFEYLSMHTGMNIHHFFQALLVWDALYIEEIKNLTLPDWTKAVYPEKLTKLHTEFYKCQTSSPENLRISVGRILHEIVQQLDYFANNSKDRPKVPKMKMYSGHDINLHFILKVLEIPHSLEIPFGAALVIELRKRSTGKMYVQIVYRTKDVEIMKIKGYKLDCEYQEFRKLLNQYSVNAEEHRSLISTLQSSL